MDRIRARPASMPASITDDGVLVTAEGPMHASNYHHDVWHAPVRHFCESAHSHGPEVWSSFSSLFISAFALWALYTGRHTNSMVKMCCAVLFWCGIGSFGFHWTLAQGWSFCDTFPMTVASVLGLYEAWIYLARHILKKLPAHRTPRQGADSRSAARFSRATSTIAILAAAILIASLVVNAVYGNIQYDNVFTTIGAVLIVTTLVVRKIVLKRGPPSSASLYTLVGVDEEVRAMLMSQSNFAPLFGGSQSASIVALGLLTVAVAGGVWETSERLCPQPRFAWMQHLHLHSIWHIAVGYGVVLLLQAFTVLTGPMLYHRHSCYANTYRNPWLNTLAPVVVYYRVIDDSGGSAKGDDESGMDMEAATEDDGDGDNSPRMLP